MTIDANIDFIRIQYLQFINSPPGIYVICFLLVQLSSYMRESKKYLKSVRVFRHISIKMLQQNIKFRVFILTYRSVILLSFPRSSSNSEFRFERSRSSWSILFF